jgi:nucleoside-diphosphate-sugar epimerase
MKVAVVGGSGFIGTWLVKELLDLGHAVKILDKNQSKKFKDIVSLGDVRDLDFLKKNLKDNDVVYNLAAEHRDDVTPTSLYYDVNVTGAKNIIAASEFNNINKIVFTSSVAVYGLNNLNPSESCSVDPFNHYGISKLKAEKVLEAWADAKEDRTLVKVRPVVVFGEGNRGNVYNLIKQVQDNKFMMVGPGNNRKSMAYVGNLAKFLASAGNFGPGQHLFNFANKPDMTVDELVKVICCCLHVNHKVPRIPFLLGLAGGYTLDLIGKLTRKKYPISSIRIRKFCANTTVATDALDSTGFVSPFTLHEGLNRMIENLDQDIYLEG